MQAPATQPEKHHASCKRQKGAAAAVRQTKERDSLIRLTQALCSVLKAPVCATVAAAVPVHEI